MLLCHLKIVFPFLIFLRLNDIHQLRLGMRDMDCYVTPPPTLASDFRELVNSEVASDVTFIVEDKPVHAHKVCPSVHHHKTQ